MKRKFFWENIRNTMGAVVAQVGAILTGVAFIVYVFVSLLLPVAVGLLGVEPLPNWLNIVLVLIVFCGTMTIVLPLVVYINIHRNRDEQIKRLNEVTDGFIINEDLVKQIKTYGVIKEAKLITNKDDFFDTLEEERTKVLDDAEIRLMNFAKTIKEQGSEEKTRNYYAREMDFYHEIHNKNVKIFKIVSIRTQKKFKECWDLAKRAEEEKLENFYLAYVDIKGFSKTPKITGVQIIGNAVILMDPCVARIDAQAHESSMFLRSEAAAEKYSSYHKSVWKEIENYHEQWCKNSNEVEEDGYTGYILYGEHKNGRHGVSDNGIWKEINQRLPLEERLDERKIR